MSEQAAPAGLGDALRRRRWAERLWATNPLPRFGRIALFLIAAVIFVGNVVDLLLGRTASLTHLTEVYTAVSIACLAWRPPLAAILLMIGGAVVAPSEVGGAYSLFLALLSGFVVYTCSHLVAAAFCLVTAAWIGVASVYSPQIDSNGVVALSVVGILSFCVGWTFQRGRRREQQLAADNARLAAESAQAIRLERERIADELHNVIAHDVTIVVMHARALELTSEPEQRAESIRAIAQASTQALTDVRRMLRVAQDGEGAQRAEENLGHEPVREALAAIAEQLRGVGMRVRADIPDEVVVSSSINTTLVHIARECATNILKHAPGARKADIALRLGAGVITLSIGNEYSGKSEQMTGASGGYGLSRMSDRVTVLGGSIEIVRELPSWRVTATLPMA